MFQWVLYVPELAANLLSCSALFRDGYDLSFNKNASIARDKEFVEFQVIRCHSDTTRHKHHHSSGVYVVKGSLRKQPKGRAMVANNETLELESHRLGQ